MGARGSATARVLVVSSPVGLLSFGTLDSFDGAALGIFANSSGT